MITQEQKDKLKLLARQLQSKSYQNGIVDECETSTERQYVNSEIATQQALHALCKAIQDLE